jgi:hypothetical protein
MPEATAVLIVAIVGATTGIASRGWNMITWRRQGPALKAKAEVVGRGDQMVITGSLRNVGRLDATVTKIILGWLSTAGRRVRIELAPDGHLTGMDIPHPLPAQAGTEFTITDIEAIDPGLYLVLHDSRPVAIIFITATGTEAKAQIKYK